MAKPLIKNSETQEIKDESKEDRDPFEIKPEWLCPICKGFMRKPVSIFGQSLKHIFCKECIKEWINISPSNPLTNEIINKNKKNIKYVRNYQLECEIREYIEYIESHPSKLANDIFEDEFEDIRPLVRKYKKVAKSVQKMLKKINIFDYKNDKNNPNNNDNNNNNNNKLDDKSLDIKNVDTIFDDMGNEAKQDIDDVVTTGKENFKNAQTIEEKKKIIKETKEQINGIKKMVCWVKCGLLKYWNKIKEWCVNVRDKYVSAMSQIISISKDIFKKCPELVQNCAKKGAKIGYYTGQVVCGITGGVSYAFIGGVIGSILGPVGSVVGAIIGGIAGGYIGVHAGGDVGYAVGGVIGGGVGIS